MEALIRGSIIVLCALCVILLIKKQRPEMALMITAITAVFLMFLFIDIMWEVRAFLEKLAELSGLSSDLMIPLLKTVGIAIIVKITSGICKDAGEGTLASGLELFGAVSAIYVTLPLFTQVIEMLTSMLTGI